MIISKATAKIFDIELKLTNTIELKGSTWIVGRDIDCDIIIDHRQASRKQIEIIKIAGAYLIKDLGSSNGSYLNDKLLSDGQTMPLRDGDVITIAAHRIIFELREVTILDRRKYVSPALKPIASDQRKALDNTVPTPEKVVAPTSTPGGKSRLNFKPTAVHFVSIVLILIAVFSLSAFKTSISEEVPTAFEKRNFRFLVIQETKPSWRHAISEYQEPISARQMADNTEATEEIPSTESKPESPKGEKNRQERAPASTPEEERTVASIPKVINPNVKQFITQSDKAYRNNNLKEAVSLLVQAKQLDPANRQIARKEYKYLLELRKRMRPLFQEAIFEEDFGSIEVAVEKWKKILEDDHEQDEYYRKAFIKLKQYKTF